MIDVVFVLEGTYPYVSGGVSSWVQALITGMPELTFGIVYLSESYKENRPLKYEIPDNVVCLLEVSVFDLVSLPPDEGADRLESWRAFSSLAGGLERGELDDFEDLFLHLGFGGKRGATVAELGTSRASWTVLTEIYKEQANETSFVDFFWTWRGALASFLQLMLVKPIPARCYHAVSTGWAGLVATNLRRIHGRPMLLTEHGIYTNERKIEILKAEWLSTMNARLSLRQELGFLRKFWINLFLALGKLAYQHADRIFSLYEGNKALQAEYGADPATIEIIPNGVRIQHLEGERTSLAQREFPRVGFVGRVVPIKDVKTLILAFKTVSASISDACLDILGPTEEDEEYFEECRALVGLLGLGDKVVFHGRVDVVEWFKKVDIQVLTSISEGQPLVILEGFCSGLPCVASDVGSCRELLEGRTDEDRALGQAGLVTGIGNPEDTAQAIITILKDPELHHSMSVAAKARVRAYYDHDEMVQTYRSIYQAAMESEGVWQA
ncbi:MAG: GT4 family glycosyltransferase PelF [Candidatus Eremiobacteraeota bacterium]|nr:GT4 family glycosyltransferase PelF [Candidatus Eremiobacteraeota bacterium]